jgi:hypothetical protein
MAELGINRAACGNLDKQALFRRQVPGRRESEMDPVTAVAAWVFALFGIAAVVVVARQGGTQHQLAHEDEDAQHLRGSWR